MLFKRELLLRFFTGIDIETTSDTQDQFILSIKCILLILHCVLFARSSTSSCVFPDLTSPFPLLGLDSHTFLILLALLP